MGNFVIIAITMGILTLVGLYLWTRLRQDLGNVELESQLAQGSANNEEKESAVIVMGAHGRVVHANQIARQWFQASQDIPDLEFMARQVNPPDSFLRLFAQAHESAFLLGERWIEGTSHVVPSDDGRRTMVVLRELNGHTATHDVLDLSAAISLVNQIGEYVNASMGVEQALQVLLEMLTKTIGSDAGEICLWHRDERALQQRGWVGDMQYLLAMAEHDSFYRNWQGVAGWIGQYRKPLLISKKHNVVSTEQLLKDIPFTSTVGIPLVLNDSFIGTLALFSQQEDGFNEGDLALLQAVAKPVTTSVYNAQLYSQQEERIRDIASLQEIVEQPRSSEGARPIYSLLNERIARLLESDISGVFLYDDDRQALSSTLPFFGLPDNVAQNIVIPLPEGSNQRDIWENQPYWSTNDAPGEPLIESLALKPLVDVAGIENIALMPMQIGQDRIGMIAIANKRTQGGFTPRDIQNLRVLVAQAAIVVENIRLYQQERRIDTELVGLQEMTHAIGALRHEDEFYAEITERIAKLMNATLCAILLHDEASNRLVGQLPFYGVDDEIAQYYGVPLEAGSVMNDIWINESYWISNHVASDPIVFEAGLDQIAELLSVQKTMTATLSAGGRNLGIVQIANKEDGTDFTDSDARLLLIFATQAAAIIENARLYNEVQRRANQADSLRKIAEMAGTVLSTNQSFTPVLQEIANYTNSQVVYVNVLDESAGSLVTYPRWVYGMKLSDPIVQDIHAEGFENSIVMSAKPFMHNDVLNAEGLIDSYVQTAKRFDLKQAIIVPLYVGDKKLGELGIANRTQGDYTLEDMQALETIAAQIGSAIDRLLLYEATGDNLRRRMEELDSISRVSNELTLTVDLDQILDAIRHEAMTSTHADGATVVLLAPTEKWVAPNRPMMERRIGDAEILPELTPIETEAVMRGADPVLVTSYANHDLEAQPTTAQSAIAVAILYLDQIVGVIHVHHTETNRFDERNSTFLLTLSTKAALGYQNAMRYQEQMERGQAQRSRIEQLNRIFELGQMIQSNAEAEVVLEAIAFSVQHSVGFDTVVMLLVDEDEGVVRRVANAGMPITTFDETRDSTLPLDKLDEILKEDFRDGETYFLPIEHFADWHVPGMKALSAAYDNNRTLYPTSAEDWHDGDMLLIRIASPTGELLGLMSLDRPHAGQRLDRSQLEVLEIFAHQASTMIENTRLFMQSQRSVQQEAQLNEVMETIAATLDLSEIVKAIAKGARNLLTFSQLTVAVLDVEQKGFDVVKLAVKNDGSSSVSQEKRGSLEHTALGRTYEERHDYFYRYDQDSVTAYDDLTTWQEQGEKASLILPLVTGGDCLGSIHIGSDTSNIREFKENHHLLLRMAQLVAGSIQNTRLFNQAMNLQVLNRSVVESIQQGIVVLDNSGRIINYNEFMQERYTWDDSALNQDLFTYQPELGEMLKESLWIVLQEGEPQEIFGQISPGAGLSEVRNHYIYPLRYGENIRGAVLLVEDVTDRVQLEQAIETRANQLAALTDVSTRITSTIERTDIIQLSLEEMGWIIQFDTMTIWRRSGSYMMLEGAAGIEDTGLDEFAIAISEHPRVRELVESQRVYAISNEDGIENNGLPGEDTAKSWLGVPLVSQGHVVGMIILTKAEAGVYETRSEQHVAFAFASQVAIALANSDLFEQTFERTNELGTLLEAAQATSLTQNLNDVFRTVAELMFNALETDFCTISIWDEIENQLEVQVQIGRDGTFDDTEAKNITYNLSDYHAKRRALENRDVVVIIQDKPKRDEPEYTKEMAELKESQYGARLLIPLLVREQAIGLIQLEQFSDDELSITQQKVRLSKALGSQVAVAIENARLSAETSSRVEELLTINALSQAISSTLQLEDMLTVIQSQVPNVTGADEMYLALFNPETEKITFPLAVKSGEPFNLPPRQLGNDEVSYIIKNKRSLSLGADYFSIDDLRKSMGITNGEGDSKSYMGIPLIAGDEVLGVLAIRDSERTRAFNLNDERILTTVGAQLGAAIQNANLYDNLNVLVDKRTDELAQEKDRLDTLYQITSELMRSLDMDQLLSRTLSMVSKAVGAEDGVILLFDTVTDSLYCRAALDPRSVYEDDIGNPSHAAEGLADWLIRHGRAHDNVIMVNDLSKADYWDKSLPNAKRWKSSIAAILESQDEPMGVMVFLNKKKNAFTDAQLKLLIAVANQVSSAFNSAELYEMIRDQADRLGDLLRNEQEEAQRHSAIVEGIADGVILANADGLIIQANTATERILGLPSDQIEGEYISRLSGMFGGSAVRWAQMIDDWQQDPTGENRPAGDYITDEFEIGARMISAHLSPVYIRNELLGTVSVFRDITKEVEVDRIKSEFITNVSHEFRTPLTPIKGFTDLLLEGMAGELNDTQKHWLSTIRENVDRLSLLVNDVLDIAKIDSHKERLDLTKVDVRGFMEDELRRIAGLAHNSEKGIQHTLVVDEDVPLIRADRDKLRHIFSNVVDNAFNYTETDGQVEIQVTMQPGNRNILWTIRDSGVGIPDHFKDAVWRRFERYDEHALELDVAGTGLGLPLAKELVLLHNGDIWFESELGKGTTFFVELPVEQPNYLTETMELPHIDVETAGD